MGALPRTSPVCRFRSGPDDTRSGTLCFNAPLMDADPVLASTKRMRVFIAEGAKPMIALVPGDEGEGIRFLPDGNTTRRMKMQGAVFAPLAGYARIDFRVEAIPEGVGGRPRPMWVLHPLNSEKKAPVSP